jgi:hypothetical protein
MAYIPPAAGEAPLGSLVAPTGLAGRSAIEGPGMGGPVRAVDVTLNPAVLGGANVQVAMGALLTAIGTGGGPGPGGLGIEQVIAGTGLTGGGQTSQVTISLISPVSVLNGGTGRTSATEALANLGGVTAQFVHDAILAAGIGGGGTGPGLELPLAIQLGGTHATTAGGALLNLGGVPLAGGQMTGFLRLVGDPRPGATNRNDAVNRGYVDDVVTELNVFEGTWRVSTNVPNLITAPKNAGNYWRAVTLDPNEPEVAAIGIPGISGQTIHNGDILIWNGNQARFELIVGGSLSITEADQWYVGKEGDVMTGHLTLPPNLNPSLYMATTRQYVDEALTAYVGGQLGGYLARGGGVMTGNITMSSGTTVQLPNLPVNSQDAVNKSYVDLEIAKVAAGEATPGMTALTGDVLAAGSGSQAAQVVRLRGYNLGATAPSANGQVLTWSTAGGGQWIPQAPGAAAAVTSITAGIGLTGGTITSQGTIGLSTPVSLLHGGTGVSAISASALLGALGGVTTAQLGNYLPTAGGNISGSLNVAGVLGNTGGMNALGGLYVAGFYPGQTYGLIVENNAEFRSQLISTGPNAFLQFAARDEPRTWGWYGFGGTARLWDSYVGEQLWVDGSGTVTWRGNFDARGWWHRPNASDFAGIFASPGQHARLKFHNDGVRDWLIGPRADNGAWTVQDMTNNYGEYLSIGTDGWTRVGGLWSGGAVQGSWVEARGEIYSGGTIYSGWDVSVGATLFAPQLNIGGLWVQNYYNWVNADNYRANYSVEGQNVSSRGSLFVNGCQLWNNNGWLDSVQSFQANDILARNNMTTNGTVSAGAFNTGGSLSAGYIWSGGDMGVNANLSINGTHGIRYIQMSGRWIGFGWGSSLDVWVDGGHVGYIAGSWSDERGKRNIDRVRKDALAALRAIELCEYDRLDLVTGEIAKHEDIGYTAQRVRPHIAEAIIDTPNVKDPLLGVDTQVMTAYNTRAIQQLADRLEELERRVEERVQ